MKARYKLGCFVQTKTNETGVITSVISEKTGVSYRLDGEPKEYPETEIVAAFRKIEPRTKKATTKKAAPRQRAKAVDSNAVSAVN